MKTRQILFVSSFLLILNLTTHAQNESKRQKVVAIDRDKKETNKVNDNKFREDMGRFMGFGIGLTLDSVEEEEENNSTDNKRKKKNSGYNLQMGFQLPRFVKTNPPNKVFKVGWKLGFNI
jgi:hypothetical protein